MVKAYVCRAAEWVIGMQSRNGGWGSFDADNTHSYLNHIPFADHGALLDPPTADVSARCVGFLAQIGTPPEHPALTAGLSYLRQTQEDDGSWLCPDDPETWATKPPEKEEKEQEEPAAPTDEPSPSE